MYGCLTIGTEANPPYLPDLDSVNLDAEEWSSDISIVTSVLKQWLRELPNPLLTHQLYDSFLDATRKFLCRALTSLF